MAQGLGVRRTQHMRDSDVVLTASQTEIASANGDNIIDLGGGDQTNTPVMYFDVIVDVSAITINDNNELYEFVLVGSSSATLASDAEPLGRMHLGALEVLKPTAEVDVDSDTGRYVMPCSNERNGRTYRYVRLDLEVSGTTPSITYSAELAMRVG